MQCIMAIIDNNIQQNDKDTTGTCACMHVCKLQFLTILVLLARIVGHNVRTYMYVHICILIMFI